VDAGAELVYANTHASLLPHAEAVDRLAEDMSETALLSRAERPCYHIALTAPQGDDLSPLDWHAVAREFVSEMGWSDRDAVGYLHRDATYPNGDERPHLHLVVNRVNGYGRALDTSWDYYRAQSALRGIEQEFGLAPELSSWEVEQRRDTPGQVQRLNRLYDESPAEVQPTQRQILQNAIDEGAESCSGLSDLARFLAKRGVDVRWRDRGWSLARDGVAFAGSELGNSYTLPEVSNRVMADEHLTAQPSVESERDREIEQPGVGDALRDLLGGESESESVAPQPEALPVNQDDRDRDVEDDPLVSDTLSDALETEREQSAERGAAIKRGAAGADRLGTQLTREDPEHFDGLSAIGASLTAAGALAATGKAVMDLLEESRDRERQDRYQNIAERFNAVSDRAEALGQKIAEIDEVEPSSGDEVGAAIDTSTQTEPDSEAEPAVLSEAEEASEGESAPVSAAFAKAGEKLGDLEEAMGVERSQDSEPSLRLDPNANFDEQLDKLEAALTNFEDRLGKLEKAVEQRLPVQKEAGSDVDLADAIANYAESRAEAYGAPPSGSIPTSRGRLDVQLGEGADDYVALSDDVYGTKFEAVRIDGSDRWTVTTDDLAEGERQAIANLPQTPDEYAEQSNGRNVVAALQTLNPEQFAADEGGVSWSTDDDTYTFKVQRIQDGSQRVVGVNSEDQRVFDATVQPSQSGPAAIAVERAGIPSEDVGSLVQRASERSEEQQRAGSAAAIARSQASKSGEKEAE